MSSAAKNSPIESPDSTWPAEKQLAFFFHRNGYVRVPDKKRRKKESRTYKMGYETRFIAKTKKEVATLERLLGKFEISPGKAYAKAEQWCVPVYGQAALEVIKGLANKNRFPALEKARDQRGGARAKK